jgi:hypothetical protein
METRAPFRDGSLMVYVGVCVGGRTDLYVCRRTMTENMYGNDIVDNILPQFQAAIRKNFVYVESVAARQDQNRVGTSNFFGQSLGQFFRVIFFFLTLHQFNGGDGYNAYYYKGETKFQDVPLFPNLDVLKMTVTLRKNNMHWVYYGK